MRKSSLGRRSTLSSAPRLSSLCSDSVRRDKGGSSIPVMVRCSSVDRQSGIGGWQKGGGGGQTPQTVNQYYNHNMNLPAGTSRPFRAATMSTDSSRLSSLGSKSKKDLRPIHDKEWQSSVEKKMHSYLSAEGSNLVHGSGSMRQMSLNTFIDIADYLLKKIDPSSEINKVNYKQELPFLMKKLHYFGKIDKSLLTTVNAPHSWPYALGILQYLLDIVDDEMCDTDLKELMYPPKFDFEEENAGLAEDPEDLWDYKKLLPYYQKCYELRHVANLADSEEEINRLTQNVIKEHFADDMDQQLENERNVVNQLHDQVRLMEAEIEKKNLNFYEETLSTLERDLHQEAEFISQLEGYLKNVNSKIQGLNMECEHLSDKLGKLKKERERVEEEAKEERLFVEENEILHSKRNSLLREMEMVNEYIQDYTSMIFKEDMHVVALKKKLDEIVYQYNMLIANATELESEFENLKIEGNPLSLDIAALNENVGNRLSRMAEHYTTANQLSQKQISLLEESIAQAEKTVDELQKLEGERILKMKKIGKEIEEAKKESEAKIETAKSELEALGKKCDHILQVLKNEKSKLGEIEKVKSEKLVKIDGMQRELKVIKEEAQLYLNGCLSSVANFDSALQDKMCRISDLLSESK